MPQARRPPLSRERVLAASLELADAEGVERLSMRRLGERLGVEAMSLYHHVPSKQALLDGIVELVLDETRAPIAGAAGWREALLGWARAFRATAHRHPRVARLFATHEPADPAWAGVVEDLLRAVRAGGLPDEDVVHAYRLVATFATGYVLYELRQASVPALGHYLERLPADAFPVTHALAPALETVDREAEYELGLALILDGFERSRAQVRRSSCTKS